jgi:hypothetical protein
MSGRDAWAEEVGSVASHGYCVAKWSLRMSRKRNGPRMVRVALTLPEDLERQVRRRMALCDMRLSVWVAAALQRWLAAVEAPPPAAARDDKETP